MYLLWIKKHPFKRYFKYIIIFLSVYGFVLFIDLLKHDTINPITIILVVFINLLFGNVWSYESFCRNGKLCLSPCQAIIDNSINENRTNLQYSPEVCKRCEYCHFLIEKEIVNISILSELVHKHLILWCVEKNIYMYKKEITVHMEKNWESIYDTELNNYL